MVLILYFCSFNTKDGMREIDIASWNRREHFEFFSRMANPFFGIVTEVDCTQAYRRAKEKGVSFFAWYLHCSMTAVNQTEAFRYRLVDGKVVVYDVIDAGATIGREDDTFAFVFVPFSFDFDAFNAALQAEIEDVNRTTGLRLSNEELGPHLIRHSTLPWTHFTGLLHPTNHDNTDSVPKITFGGLSERDGKKYLPVSVEAHHGLMDGLHISRYLETFQRLLHES